MQYDPPLGRYVLACAIHFLFRWLFTCVNLFLEWLVKWFIQQLGDQYYLPRHQHRSSSPVPIALISPKNIKSIRGVDAGDNSAIQH